MSRRLLNKTREIICKTADKISKARNNKENLQDLFFEIIADLSAERSQLAYDHDTEDKSDFGKRRDLKPGAISFIILNGTYLKYGDKILSFFFYILKKNGTAKRTI